MDDPELRLDPRTLLVKSSCSHLQTSANGVQPVETAAGVDLSIPDYALNERRYSVAVTGDVFRWMVDFGNEDVLNRVSSHCI